MRVDVPRDDVPPIVRRLERTKRALRLDKDTEHEINRLYHNGLVSIDTLRTYYGIDRESLRIILRLD